jgi:hypothetical protein
MTGPADPLKIWKRNCRKTRICRQCEYKKRQLRQEKKRTPIKKFLLELKISRGGCSRCPSIPNEFWDWEAFEWDHVRGIKEFNVSEAVNFPAKKFPSFDALKIKVMDEVAKCDLLCANCHRTVTCRRKQLGNVRRFAYAQIIPGSTIIGIDVA